MNCYLEYLEENLNISWENISDAKSFITYLQNNIYKLFPNRWPVELTSKKLHFVIENKEQAFEVINLVKNKIQQFESDILCQLSLPKGRGF